MYPESFVKELESTIPISDLIGKKLPLKKRGRDFVACCPFHHEKTPSFSVSDMKGIYHCFGCGKSGNIFTFVMEMEGLNFKEAIEYLANLYGIALPKIEHKKEVKKEEVDEIELIYKVNEESCKFFESCLTEFYAKDAQAYAKKRGLTKENIKKFRIGFAPNDFSMLINYLKKLGYDEDVIEKAGVIARKDRGGYYDKFRNRLIFPVLDKKGRVIAFTGRILDDGMPKYMNSPETKIYTKGNVLFNYFFARKAIYDKKFAVLVEGNMDALSLFINGVDNTVAPMGTGITENQIKELWASTDNIFVCLDGDSAGRKASVRLAKLVLPIISTGKNMNFVFLPDGIDPDDFIRKFGKIEFDKLLNKSIPLSNYLWNNELIALDINNSQEVTPEKKAQLEKNIFILIENIKDTKLKNHFEKFYNNKIWKLSSHSNKKIITTIKKITAKVDLELSEKIGTYEKKICELLIKYPNLSIELSNIYKIDIFTLNFINDNYNKIINIIEEFLNSENNSENLEKLLVKNDLNTYINSKDIFFNNSYINSLTEEKSLKIVHLLLLEREVMLLEFDLKEASNLGDIIKANNLSKELKKLKTKISSFLTEDSFI
ncbi:MAG TPA: DNA primase [Rickettsiales bacterium]|nr:DNA primase [Rickettsiales bacterium]